MDTNAVQRHRNIILDCLRDGDISIRRRALELSYALINEQNVRILIRELLAFLELADDEFKLGMTTQICLAAERFAPNKRWHIDTVLRVLKLVRLPSSCHTITPVLGCSRMFWNDRPGISCGRKSCRHLFDSWRIHQNCRRTRRPSCTQLSIRTFRRNHSRWLPRG
jgi:hypothetical protein